MFSTKGSIWGVARFSYFCKKRFNMGELSDFHVLVQKVQYG